MLQEVSERKYWNCRNRFQHKAQGPSTSGICRAIDGTPGLICETRYNLEWLFLIYKIKGKSRGNWTNLGASGFGFIALGVPSLALQIWRHFFLDGPWSRINEAKTTVWRKHCRKPLFRAITNIIKIRGVKFEERELISDDVKKIQTVCRVIDRLHWISVIWWDVGDKTKLGDQSGEHISENPYFGLSPTS